MGVFDLPAPLLAWLDGGLGQIAPPTLRLIFWGLVGGAASMALYWLLSPQRELAGTKAEAAQARRSLDAYDGDFAEAWPLIRRVFGLALRQLRLVLWPALAAAAPALCLFAWLSSAYGYSFPGALASIDVKTAPGELQAQLVTPAPGAPEHQIVVADQAGRVVGMVPWAAPIATIHKRQWWNILFGNPAGYLPADSEVERIELGLAPNEYLPFGPSWLRPWYAVFFAALLAGSLAVKFVGRVEL